MIIQGLQAENLFKYSNISISGLENRERILISGPNESGKTAIIEAICLGLFGRTASLETNQLAKAIKWGEDRATITVTFLGRDARSYSVFRYIDGTGEQQASLSLTGDAEPISKGVEAVDDAMVDLLGFGFQHYLDTLYLTQTAVAASSRDKTIKTLAGVADLDTLANQLDAEVRADMASVEQGDTQRRALQERLAILNLQEGALASLEQEQTALHTRTTALESDKERWNTFTAAMQGAAAAIDDAALRISQSAPDSTLKAWHERVKPLDQALGNMEEVCRHNQVEMETSPGKKLQAWVDDLQKRLSGLTPIMTAVEQDRRKLATWLGDLHGTGDVTTLELEAARLDDDVALCAGRRARSGRLGLITLVLALLIGSVGGLLKFLPDAAPSQTLMTHLLQSHMITWQPSMALYPLILALLFLFVALASIKRSFAMRHQIADHMQQRDVLEMRAIHARQVIGKMDTAAHASLAKQLELLTQLDQTAWGGELAKWCEAAGSVFLKEKTFRKFFGKLEDALASFRSNMASHTADIDGQVASCEEEKVQCAERLTQLETEINVEKERREQDRTLRTQREELERNQQRWRRNVEIKRLASSLLTGACQGLSSRFNQELRRFIAKAAPLFTHGRYQHLRIDATLNVSVFSTVKNDFVDFTELSTGVRYQLSLAVRMALAQALTARTRSAPQFMVLDEPFVFFDRQRVRESLDALLNVSEHITQAWVVTQEYEPPAEGEDTRDLALACIIDNDTLRVH